MEAVGLVGYAHPFGGLGPKGTEASGQESKQERREASNSDPCWEASGSNKDTRTSSDIYLTSGPH